MSTGTIESGKQHQRHTTRFSLARWASGLVLLAATLACLSSPFMALYQARQPFPGFLLEPTMVISSVGNDDWPGRARGLTHPWRVVAVNDVPVSRPADLNDYLRQQPLGTSLQYTVEHPDGERRAWPEAVPSSLMSTSDVVLLFWGPYLAAISYLVCGIWIYWARRDKLPVHACVALCAGVALALSLFSSVLNGHSWGHMWSFALSLSAAAGIHLFLVFPEPLPLLRRIRWLAWLPYLLVVGLVPWTEVAYASASNPWAYFVPWRWAYAAISLSALLTIGRLLHTRYFSPKSQLRQQARSVLLGGLLAFLPIVVGLGSALLQFDLNPYLPLIFCCLPIFPFALAYAIAREHLLDLDRVISRSLAYSLLMLLQIALYLGMVCMIGRLAPGILRADDPLALAFLIIVATLVVSPLQRHLRQLVDRLLYRERVNFRRVVQQFGHSLSKVIDLPELSQLILQRVVDTLHLDMASLYLFDQRSGTYRRYKVLGQLSGSVPVFAETDPFIQRLRVANGAVYRHHRKGAWLHSLPPEERERVDQLYGLVFLPLTTQSHLIGWLNLGARLSGEAYSSEDLDLLNALADRAAVAIENALLFAERERRLTELAVLNEIGQAINSALSLEQVLNTIYEGTGRLMDTTNFSIALYNPEREEITFSLHVRNGSIIDPWSRRWGNGLTEYILRTQQPILIAERVEETIRNLGVDVIGASATSWLGVPIMIEEQAIGVIAVQSTRPETTYDVEDMDILSAIANQAGIAIKNARLYESTDQALSHRLEEIAVMADFAHTLATVALDSAQVAEQTLCRAVETLDASMGVLVHYDQTRNTLEPLARLRWPAQRGWEKVWRNLLPDLHSADLGIRIYSDKDLETLDLPQESAPIQWICPLVRENQLLALLHLGLPADARTDPGRRRFLRHLADHAAIALENALLYQLQVRQNEALECRTRHLTNVLDLSNALRANLPLDQILQAVVEAARDTLGCRIVLIELAEDDDPSHLRRAVAAGLDADTLRRLQAERIPLSSYQNIMQPEFRLGHSYLVGEDAATAAATAAATWDQLPAHNVRHPGGPDEPGATAQRCLLLTPLRGVEDRLLGILSLYHVPDCQIPDPDIIEIVEILANQAATAIENAHLYQALHEANEAKSEFLSIVAHELQVPMRVIWSYADLLIQDPSGEDRANQRGFLQIIKANIGRLNALVDDLLEVSRIEAGKIQLAPVPLHLHEVVLENVAALRPQLEHKGLTLTTDLPEGLPPVIADWDRLSQILSNLLSNAVKYTTAPGQISVSVRLLRHAADLNGTGPHPNHLPCPCVCISIRDSGIGLSPQDKKRLFSRFFRSEHPLVRQEMGTGLGLYLVRLLVEEHRGQIWVESDLGKGSTFHVALPLDGPGKNKRVS